MKTRIEKIDKNRIDKNIMKDAGDILKQGGLVAFPTETVYGYVPIELVNELAEKHGGIVNEVES